MHPGTEHIPVAICHDHKALSRTVAAEIVAYAQARADAG